MLTSRLTAGITALQTGTVGLSTLQYPLNIPDLLNISLADGTGANKADQIYTAQQTLSASGTTTYDLFEFGGATDPFGNSYALLSVKMLIIQNLSTTSSDLLSIGNDATSGAWISPFGSNSQVFKIRGGATLILAASDAIAYPVVDGTNHLLKVTNAGAGSVTFKIIVVGATA